MPEPNTRCGIPLDQAKDPFELFDCWLKDATHSELNDPNAMSLATATPEGRPSVRMVLLKKADPQGFTFYTNRESRKGTELLANPYAALCIHWKSRRRQVRVEGSVTELGREDVAEYFHTRHRKSQLGAVASQQSRVLGDKQILMDRAAELDREYPEEIPLPDYWTGFRLIPEAIEFWQDGEFRLHDRILFTAAAGGWSTVRLYP